MPKQRSKSVSIQRRAQLCNRSLPRVRDRMDDGNLLLAATHNRCPLKSSADWINVPTLPTDFSFTPPECTAPNGKQHEPMKLTPTKHTNVEDHHQKSPQARLRVLWLLGLITCLCTVDDMRTNAAEQTSRPNILLIFADDLGWRDVGYNGTDFYETPVIDKFRTEGMVFHHGYAAAGNCAPSRACLLSGTYTPRHHVYAVGSTDRGPKRSQRLVSIPNKSGLAVDNITMADALRGGGYATGIFGKWHLSGADGAKPEEQGFDVVFDSRGGNPNAKRDVPDDPKGIFSITKAAGEFMEKSHTEGKPFFAYVAHHAIHTALEARPKTLEQFQKKAKGQQHSHAMYAACLYDLDAGVGQLLAKLEQLDIAKNTLVVFTSDNGGTQQSSQEPLRGNKGGYYEGGIREPFIVRWPGVTIPGSECSVPVINVDLYPTFLAAAGIPPEKELDGEDLRPLLSQAGPLTRKSVFWHFPGYLDGPVIRGREGDVQLGFRTRPVSVIRKGDWKLHLFHEEWKLDGGHEKIASNKAVELYNIAKDQGEHTNLASSDATKRDELIRDLLAWQQAVNAQMPTVPNPTHEPGKTGNKSGKALRKNKKSP
ncbi:MAG: sulfatase [Planctomycetaceae bacterium]